MIGRTPSLPAGWREHEQELVLVGARRGATAANCRDAKPVRRTAPGSLALLARAALLENDSERNLLLWAADTEGSPLQMVRDETEKPRDHHFVALASEREA